MQTAHATQPDHADPRSATRHRVGRAVWLLPAFGVLTLWATLTHQPSPSTDFVLWAQFVTTDEFLAKHLLGSIVGLALSTVGVAAVVFLVLDSGRHLRAAVWGFILTVLGSAGLLAGFGVAAFAQPAIGNLELQQFAGAHGVYDDVYGIPAFATLIGGGVLFAIATVVVARAAAAIDGVPRLARIAFGASGPLIAFFGIAFGAAQTLGSLAAIAGGTAIALAVHRSGDPRPPATP